MKQSNLEQFPKIPVIVRDKKGHAYTEIVGKDFEDIVVQEHGQTVYLEGSCGSVTVLGDRCRIIVREFASPIVLVGNECELIFNSANSKVELTTFISVIGNNCDIKIDDPVLVTCSVINIAGYQTSLSGKIINSVVNVSESKCQIHLCGYSNVFNFHIEGDGILYDGGNNNLINITSALSNSIEVDIHGENSVLITLDPTTKVRGVKGTRLIYFLEKGKTDEDDNYECVSILETIKKFTIGKRLKENTWYTNNDFCHIDPVKTVPGLIHLGWDSEKKDLRTWLNTSIDTNDDY